MPPRRRADRTRSKKPAGVGSPEEAFMRRVQEEAVAMVRRCLEELLQHIVSRDDEMMRSLHPLRTALTSLNALAAEAVTKEEVHRLTVEVQQLGAIITKMREQMDELLAYLGIIPPSKGDIPMDIDANAIINTDTAQISPAPPAFSATTVSPRTVGNEELRAQLELDAVLAQYDGILSWTGDIPIDIDAIVNTDTAQVSPAPPASSGAAAPVSPVPTTESKSV